MTVTGIEVAGGEPHWHPCALLPRPNTVCRILFSREHILLEKPGTPLQHGEVKNNRSSNTSRLFLRMWDSDRFEDSVQGQYHLHDPNF